MYFFVFVFYFFVNLFEACNENTPVIETGNRIDATRIRQELQEQDSGKNYKKKESGKNYKKKESGKNYKKKESGKNLRIKESYKNYKKKRIRQEFKNTRILAGGTSLALPAKLRSTWILPES